MRQLVVHDQLESEKLVRSSKSSRAGKLWGLDERLVASQLSAFRPLSIGDAQPWKLDNESCSHGSGTCRFVVAAVVVHWKEAGEEEAAPMDSKSGR